MAGIQPDKENPTHRAAYSRRASDEDFSVSAFLLMLVCVSSPAVHPHFLGVNIALPDYAAHIGVGGNIIWLCNGRV
ncbi:MAG: hypothetical protein HOP24_05475 [Sideroxydans sp.]|nr:hypothetical protein [Sideroxydans sp.]